MIENVQRLYIVQRLSSAVGRQALAWRCFPEPSDAPRKLGTGTIEDNRRTMISVEQWKLTNQLFDGSTLVDNRSWPSIEILDERRVGFYPQMMVYGG